MTITLHKKMQIRFWFEYNGDDGDVDITQQSGTCPTGVTTVQER